MQAGEVFLTNASENSFSLIGWKTKRKGTTLVDFRPRPRQDPKDFFPVFVQVGEIRESSPETLKRLGFAN